MTTTPKRPFTLIEVLVSAFLGVFLIAALVQLTYFSKQQERVSTEIGRGALAWLEAKERLEESLALAEPIGTTERAEGSGLHFMFDNGIDIDPSFCGRCKARLWQKERALFLTIFGKEKERTREVWRGDGPITFTLWDGKEKKPALSARIDRSIQAVVIGLGGQKLICFLHRARADE